MTLCSNEFVERLIQALIAIFLEEIQAPQLIMNSRIE